MKAIDWDMPYNGNLPAGCRDADCDPEPIEHVTETCDRCGMTFDGWGEDAACDAEAKLWEHANDCDEQGESKWLAMAVEITLGKPPIPERGE